jgi:hypothetical protein
VTLVGSDCVPENDGNKKLKKSDGDLLAFRFSADGCTSKQAVKVCFTPLTTGVTTAPWKDCVGLPAGNDAAKIGDKFDFSPGVGAAALCDLAALSAKHEYYVCVVTGTAGTDPACPTITTPCANASRGSELAMEIQP